ncbi:MAG: NADH-quinone oxidoreductase subunit NuoG [candidate division Zixibacteria bacterium]|nr:NADH-quinone oxidoreductase subunit NuoG [candidate division Zixibacteria bacterium]
MINVTIDGRKIELEKGTTILKAAEKLGIHIPTFCWHEKLEPFGGCRLCLVEVENTPKLQIACATEVCDGMIVRTDTPRVIKARKGVLEFLLINHPLDCPTCDKGGECELQDAVFRYGSPQSRFIEKKRRYIVDENSTFDDLTIGPQIVRNMNRCIHCLKCIRFIDQIAGEDDLGAFKRGYRTEINILPDIPVDNNLSGNVVELCPVGALTNKAFRYKIRAWLLKKIATVCPNCGDGCNINIWIKDEKLYRVSSNRNDKIDEWFICDKGRFGCDFVNSQDRLREPLIKEGNHLVVASWEKAIGLVAKRLTQIKNKFGSDALAGLGSPICTNEDNYIFQKFFRTVIGTNNLDFRVSLSSLLPSPDLSNYNALYTMTNSIADLERAETILVFGSDLANEHPIISLRVRKAVRKNNAKLILVNPAHTEMSRFASQEMIYKKGSEIALINGLLNLIINDSKFNSENLNLDSEELRKISNELKEYALDKTSSTCGIEKDELQKLKETILSSKNLIILAGNEVLNHSQNEGVIQSLNNLFVLTGHLNKKESGFNLLWQDCNSQGAIDMGLLPDRLPGLVPTKAGYNFNQMLKAASAGTLKSIYFMQANPFLKYPDKNLVKSALEKLDFIVVQDIFASELTEMADVVLPACTFAEKDGTFTNVERRAQKLKKGFEPIRNSKPDWQIINELALNMGQDFSYRSASQITEEIGKIVKLYSGIKYESLNADGFQWSCSVLEERKPFKIEIADHKE